MFALFLACVMLFSATPVQAFAQEDTSYLIEETNPQEDVNLIEDTGLTETVNLGEDINLSGDTGPSEGTELSENTNTTEDSELIIEGEESEANPLETEGEESEANPTETEGEEAIEETVQTEMEDPIDDTELLEGTETTENLQPEETLPKDITNCMDQLTLSMKKWWYEDQENTVDVTEEKYVDFSEFIQDPDEPVWAGVSLKYEAVGFQEGDWFTVVLPEQFEDVQIEEGFVFPEGMEGSLKELEEPEQGTELTMRFSTVEETFDGELPLQFRLSALEDVSILLQEDADRQNEYVVIPPFAETEQEGMVGVFSLRSGKAETNTFSIKGEIVFDENLGGTDWRSILRPLEFDQNIKLIATYQDASGVDHTVEYYAQDSAPQDEFYLMMTHDGEGGGSFEIINVPKMVTLENGFNAEVTKYNVSVDTKYPYYENENGGFDVTDMGATQTISTLRLKVKSQNLTLDPNVVGDQTPATFPMDVTFTKSSGAVTEQSTLSKTVNPTNAQNGAVTLQVPVGIEFKAEQSPVPGYKLDPEYKVTSQTAGSEPVLATQTGKAEGTIEEGTDVTVTTKNYMQNLTYPFSVIWVDNNSSARPNLGEDSFKLQYKTASGEWTDLTEASKETLGIDNLPTFDASNAALGKYVYRGLPSIDAEGNSLTYQVVPLAQEGYAVSANETNTEFTYRKTTTFNATISWMDSDNADNKRPDNLPLKLYRRAGNGSYELVMDSVPVNKNNDNAWSVSVPDLPRYNDSNQEYDYVMVQGTIGENNTVTQTTIDAYKTSYSNGTGNYGNDIALCHNNGTISQRISGEVDFSAVKKWKDNGNISDRPETTVTLWRYSVPKDGDHSIDTMYNSGLAAQVIYRKTTTDASGNPTYQDVLLSYQLKNQNSETITFDHSTVSGLPDDFRLPAYDEQGRRYVYFVRETVDSEYYETTYTSSTGDTLAQGAPNNGSITNTRREKSEVNITKIWQCPSNLLDIEGLSVQMTILAPDQNGNYEELTVYSADLNSFRKLNGGEKTAAQTLSGFAESIATLDLQFYVNIYDENGLPYLMENAVIREIKVLDQAGNEINVAYSDAEKPGTGTFTLKGNQYTAVSTYNGKTELPDGMKQYQYKETNTISGTRNYTLIKKWQGFEASELYNYAYVSFRLTRRSSKDGAQDETVQTPKGENTWVVSKQEGEQWQRLLENLPKYDPQGYEYLYSATEVAVTDRNGNLVSPQNWFSYHYRTENSTTVTNYKGTGGGGALYVAKTWMDNGDTKTRKAVSVRIYRKSDVLTALTDKSENEIVSLGNLGIGYASYRLSGEINWFGEVALATVETNIVQNGGSPAQSNLGAEDYLILEYQVGGETDGAVPASYTVSQLRAAAKSGNVYTVSGTVSNSKRQYQTVVNRADNGTMVTITNTRIGQASLEITKNWKDENNAGGQRPNSVQFQVYQDGQVYIPGEGSGIGSINNQESVSATWNRATGIITMSYTGDANTAYDWKLRLENLPLFSETGVPHTYNVEEIVGTGQTGSESQTGGTSSTGSTVSSSYYLTTKDNITVTPHTGTPDHVTYGFTFDNTLTGTTVHSAHKTWNDIDSGGFDRPDLYLTLYRYLKSDAQADPDKPVDKLGSFRKYTDCEDPIWTVDNAYHWRAEVGDLPLYDDQGREYVYRFQEALNNNGVTVYGTYMQTAQYHLEVECETCKNLNISYSTPYDKFTNTLTDNMTVSGVKTWKGFEGYEIEQKDYPTVTIELYRSLNPNINPLNKKDTDAEFQQWRNSGTIEEVGKAELSYDDENDTYPTTYSFGTKSNPLPKFNGEGRRWYYSIREVFPDTITNSLYTENFDNGTLTNVFLKNGNRRTIQVMKTWNRGKLLENEKDKYPSVTYYLYRYEEGVNPEKAALLKSIQVPANDVAANANWAATGEGQEKPPLCEFKDLLIYSPSGKPYYYYVTEKAISGYSISYSDEAGIGEGYSGNGRSDVISIPENPFTQESDHTVKVGTTNTYDNPGLLNISGKKYWNDYGNSDLIYGKRPDSIEVTLKRHTQNESGQANMISEETIDLNSGEEGKPQIVWEKKLNTEPNFWKYTITNLERYAPNGMPYIYSVKETPVDGYKQSNGTVTGTAGATGDLNLNVLTNSLGTTYYVRKNWMDGNNKYGLRPTSITVVLQRSNDGGANWQNIQWEDSFGSYHEATKKWTGLPSVTTDENGNNIVSIRLTADYVMNNTRGNSWQYTFTNLPEKDKDGKIWTYRCIETKIDNAAVEEKNNIFKAGAYTCTYPIQDDAKTVIQNKLESTSLHVTKNWEGDQNDLYHSRPDSITFVLQMRGIVQTDTPSVSPESGGTSGESGGASGEPGSSEGDFDLSDWQNVKVDGRDTFTISKADNWQKTLQDLPVAIVGEDGRTYYTLYFRAVEKHADDTVDENGNTVQGSKVLGAQNYQDTTDYDSDFPDHSYNSELSRNESTITNKLILDDPKKSISVTKKWWRVPGASVEATLELQYKTTEESSWHSYAQPVLKKVSSTKSDSQTVGWTDLPKYDRNGKALVYQVVEHPLQGYKTEIATNGDSVTPYATQYTFTNIELQSYTVKKIWQNTDDAEKADKRFTATFQLQQKEGTNGEWKDVEGQEIPLISTSANDRTKEHTWQNLPKYTTDGKEITYRAVETQINGKNVTNNTNGSYMVSYAYDGTKTQPSFKGTETTATNRMIYGFVNLSKKAAYLAPGVTENDGKLKGVKFNIYQGNGLIGEDTKPYVSDVETDENGNLINTNGKYGTEQKYLISGTYTLKEASTNPDYSVWAKGVTFTVGIGNTDLTTGTLQDTGEHGTAWISTTGIGSMTLGLQVEYKNEYTLQNHSIGDTCQVYSNTEAAVNLESRGVLSFTKTGPLSGSTYEPLDTHGDAAGESSAYFGVYLDEDCKNQVAGMVPKPMVSNNPADKTTMILTDKAQDGTTTLEEKKDVSGVPYLRAYTNTSYPQYPFTLLTGTYYIKELVAPAGYKLDTNIRKAVVKKIDSTAIGEDLSGVYPGNQAQIMLVSEENGTDDYKWSNTPNVVTLYKRDQYGRPVTLKENGYLELKIDGTSNTFPSGESTIRLYQNTTTPATKIDGTTGITGYVSYDATEGAWIITGLFDIGKTYTLSEPDDSVPNENIKANLISFQMKEDGSIVVTSPANETESKADPLAVQGDDYKNYYKSDAGNNVVVMRDVSRYLKDVALEKKDSDTNKEIPNISFKLYKYDGKDENTGELKNVKSVLEDKVYLTTNNEGKILLSEQNVSIKNQITDCALIYGLDVGKYYFEEVERGASDKYRLVGDIFFEIKPTTESGTATDYSDYATVTFDTSGGHVSQNPEDGKMGTVTNDPVTKSPKKLILTKVDSANSNQKLGGARFTLTYQSVTHGDAGSETSDGKPVVTWNCITNNNGELYLADANWEPTINKPDISKKGTYILKEIKAPDIYMTHTKDGTETLVTLVEFTMNSSNQIEKVKKYNETDTLADVTFLSTAEPGEESSTTRTYKDTDYRADALVNVSLITKNDGEHDSLSVELKNEKTVVSIAKRNDIESGTKTRNQKSLNGEELSGATLSIYEGIQPDPVAEDSPVIFETVGNVWNLPQGTLKEDTIYTLVETTSPIGYMKADPIYFKLHGTTVKDGKCISQLYVWTGTGNPTVDAAVGWEKTANIKDKVLIMVDEAVIAPVDMRKVVNVNETKSVLQGTKFLVADGSVELSSIDVDEALKADSAYPENALGIAVTDANGYLVWEKIFDAGYDSKHIFTTEGKRAETDIDGALNNTIILQQNANGYTFTEIYAPDQAYNKHESFTVKITDQNYKDYKTTAGYNTNKYIDIKAASGNADKTASSLSDRTTSADFADAYENPGFKTTFQLYKYDAEDSKIKAEHNNYEEIGMKDVTFTLSKKQADGSYKEVGDYTTGEKGLLSISIAKKGTYKLVETKTLTGYILNAKEMIFTIVNDDYQKTLTYSAADGNSNHTAVVRNTDNTEVANAVTYDLPNYREHGTVTLTKQDANSNVKLNGVTYTLKRTSPEVNANVDKYFPSTEVSSLTVETGKTYSNVAGAAQADKIQVTDGNDGVLTIQDLQWGTYTLVEQQENNGYILVNKEYTFEITANGLNKTITDTGKNVVENTKNKLTIKKTALDETTALSGAEFTLYPVTSTDDENGGTTKTMGTDPAIFYASADATSISKSTTITAGETTIYGLTKGTYVLRETKAPDGYELAKDVIFTMSAHGTISDVTTCTVGTDHQITEDADGSAVVTFATDGHGTSNAHSTMTVKDTPIEVSLKKVDSEIPDTGLKGAVYEISGTKFSASALSSTTHTGPTGENETITVTLNASDTNGIVRIPSALLVAGETYTIHEMTAPDSFELGVDVTITVNTDGTVILPDNSGNNAQAVMLNADGSVDNVGTIVGIRLEDTPIKVTINKTFEGADNMDLTEGAVFKITPAESSSFADTNVGNDATTNGYLQEGMSGFTKTSNTVYLKVTAGTTGENKGKGSIEIPKGLLKQGQSYILTEVATSTGYQLSDATNHITFTVGMDGVITFAEQKEGATTFEGTGTDALNVKNTRINFSIVKTSNETTSEYDLTNVQLTLTRVDESGEPLYGTDAYNRQWPTSEEITNKEKYATNPESFVGLAAGWYQLTESTRPAGYLQADPIYFKVNQDNTVQLAKISASGKLEPDTTDTNHVISQIQDTNCYLVTMKNTLIRGHVKFTKVFSNDSNKPVQDAVFTMYKVVGKTDGDNNTETDDIVIATGLRTNENGAWTSVGNTKERFNSAAYAVEHASETDTLAKGLTVGTYYLVETGCDGSYLDANARNKKYTFIIQDATGNDNKQSSHYQSDNDVVTIDGDSSIEGANPISNTPYTAAFRIWKTEDADHDYASISNAEFQIWYSGTFDVDEDNHRIYHLIYTGVTNDNGLITKTVAEKGWYLIKETSNQGYEISDTYYAFQLTDDQYGSSEAAPIWLKHTTSDTNGTLYLMQSNDPIQIVSDAKVNQLVVSTNSSNTFVAGDGIENTRKTVNLQLTKVDSADNNHKLEGVQFDLYKKADIGTDGKPLEGKNPAAGGTTDGQGQILFKGLDWGAWGEYILVEKETIPGYHTRANIPITLVRDLFTDPDKTPVYILTSDVAANEQMKLKICKKANDLTALDGAVFALYPADKVTVETNGTVKTEDAPVVSGLVTDMHGEVTLNGVLVGGSSYALVEITPPKGYKVSLPVYFTVDKKGIISPMDGMTLDSSATIIPAVTDSLTGNYKSDNIITVKDTQIQISLTKKNSGGDLTLTGAAFTVTGKFADGTTEKKDITIVNGSVQGALVGQLIAGEKYTFTETTAPEGYELLTAVVSVDIYGQLHVESVTNGLADSQNPINVHTGDAGLAFKDTPIEVSITKNDRDETDESKKTITNNPAAYKLKPAEGSKFALKKTDLSGYTITTGTDGETVTSITLVTGADGKVSIPSALLIAGNQYELTETIAPEGYELATYSLLFTVNADGTLTLNHSAGQLTKEYNIDADDKTVIIAQDKKISIKINKKDTVNNKNALSGAQFKVTGVFAGETTEGDIEVTVTDDGEISALTGKLVSGHSYTFTEIVPPQGYELDPAITFVIKVNADGSFTKESGSDAIAVHTGDLEMIDVTNQPVEVTIKKVDNDDQNKVLPQAVFTIKPDTNSDFADLFKKDQTGRTTVFTYDSVENQITVTTGEDGTISIPSGALVINNTYVLTETNAPNGYELAGKVKFTVKKDGRIESVSITDGSGSASAVTLNENVVGLQVTDKLIDAKIVKVGGILKKPLNGVKFTLEPAEGSEFAKTPTNPALTDNKLTLTTANVNGEAGVILIEKGILKQKNTYVLKEISTIDGYYLGSSAKEGVELYVSEDGSLSVNGKNGEDAKQKPPYKIFVDAEVTVTNPQTTKFTITKEVTGNMGDLGGSFDITMKLTEADGSPILNNAGKETTTVTLKKDETYDSTTDYGVNGIPVGATVEITEPEDLCYTAKIKVEGDAHYTENVGGDRGKATVVLNPNGNSEDVKITLTNHKDVAIDVGVNTENQAPWAALSLILPAIWLAYRYRRKRKGGEG